MFARIVRLISKALPLKAFTDKSGESTGNQAKKADVDHATEPDVEVIKTVSGTSQREHTSSEPVVVIDSTTGKVVEEEYSSKDFSHPLPKDIAKLAAQNQAFAQGIFALQKLNLDEDLFQDALEKLRKKYYKQP